MTTTSRKTLIASRLLTGEKGKEITNGAVTYEDNKIIWVSSADNLISEPGEIIDYGDNSTILPGMIDTHVHLAFDGSANPVERMKKSTKIELFALMLRSARELLSVGVTTARDLGASELLDVEVKNTINSGEARGPRILSVNAPLTVTGGHCFFMGGEAETVDGVRQAVRKARRDGADHIKIMATGGNMTPGTLPAEPQFTQEEMNTIVETAHHYGMKVAAHCHGVEGIRRSIEAGVDSLEHFSFQLPNDDRRLDMDLVKKAGDGGFYASLTMCASAGPFINQKPDVFQQDCARIEVDNGVNIVAGSDSGIDFAPHTEYVFSLEGLAVYGMTNDEVLYAATSLAAESLGLSDVTGTLKEGLEADIIVVNGNPREDLGNLRKIQHVIARGIPYIPEFSSEDSWNQSVKSLQYVPK